MRATRLMMMVCGLLLASVGAPVFAESNSQGEGSFLAHYRRLVFNVPPGQTASIPMPVRDTPVRIDVASSNVTVSFNNTVTDFGPLVLSTVASFDSRAGLGNISGSTQCVGHDWCEALAAHNLPEPNFYVANIFLFVRINRHTGDLSLGVRSTRGDVVVTNDRIQYVVTLWY